MASRGSSRKSHHQSSKSIDLSDLHPPGQDQYHHHHHHHHHRRRSKSRDNVEDEDAGDDEADGDSDVLLRPVLKPSLPPKPSLVNPPVSFNDNKHSESENSLVVAINTRTTASDNAAMATVLSTSASTAIDGTNGIHEGSGTVRRRSRGGHTRSTSRPHSSGEEILAQQQQILSTSDGTSGPEPITTTTRAAVEVAPIHSQRSSLSQTPEEDEDEDRSGVDGEEEDNESSPVSRIRKRKQKVAAHQASTSVDASDAGDLANRGAVKIKDPERAGSHEESSSSPKVHHFRHFDYKEASKSSKIPSSGVMLPPPARGDTFYTRPRSASIGHRISADEEPEEDDDHRPHHAHYHHHYRHRRHHTLDGHRGASGAAAVGHFEDDEEEHHRGMTTSFVPMAASSRSISSKSEKSSSRSSHSPSVENIRHGKTFFGLE